ncbi:hypothetical protein LUZ60_011635 [Juncus effusus]|nr:hypothetical protein LUZ60_011635 [Juncus effusus]
MAAPVDRYYLGGRAQHTSCYIWATAIICAILAVAVIITVIVVLVIYFIYQPKSPFMYVNSAHLSRLDYDQFGTLDTDLQLTFIAENDNRKADSTFYNLTFYLGFYDVNIALLQANDFDVPRNSTVPLGYEVQSTPIPLDRGGVSMMDMALKNMRIPFTLTGQVKTRWRLGRFFYVKFWAHLSCQIEFSWPNGTAIDLDCSTKTKTDIPLKLASLFPLSKAAPKIEQNINFRRLKTSENLFISPKAARIPTATVRNAKVETRETRLKISAKSTPNQIALTSWKGKRKLKVSSLSLSLSLSSNHAKAIQIDR